MQLDALIAIGDLTASEPIDEKIFFVDNGLFDTLGRILQDIKKQVKDFRNNPKRCLKFKELVVWILSNGLADSSKC